MSFDPYTIIAGLVLLAIVVVLARGKKKRGGTGGSNALRISGAGLSRVQRITTWLHAGQFAPADIRNTDSAFYMVSDHVIDTWLDHTKNTGCNAVSIMVCGYILKNDATLDEAWASRISRAIDAAASRSIDCCIQVGGFWGRARNRVDTVEGRDQLLDWWGGLNATIEYYLGYCGSTWGLRGNVWFAFNEVDHSGLGTEFRQHAAKYVDRLTAAARRPVPVGISEQGAWINHAQVVRLAHDERAFQQPGIVWGYDEQAGGQNRWSWQAARAAEYDSANRAARSNGASVLCVASWTPNKITGPDPIYLERLRVMASLR
jgi:hypothetical protein